VNNGDYVGLRGVKRREDEKKSKPRKKRKVKNFVEIKILPLEIDNRKIRKNNNLEK
jgi:hypothetical protein